MAHIEVNGAQLWVEEAGSGPAVVLVHGGLGDARLWDEQFGAFAERFRTVRYDLRFFGRSEGPGTHYSHADGCGHGDVVPRGPESDQRQAVTSPCGSRT